MVDLPGVIHVHSTYSDGTESPERIMEVADRQGLAFAVLTEHNTLRPLRDGKAGVYGHCRLILGEEITPPRNHYLALGISRPVPPCDNPQEFISSVAAQGGLGFIAHPYYSGRTFYGSADVRWTDWSAVGFSGLEIWNLGCDMVGNMNTLGRAIWYTLFATAAVKGPDEQALLKWDELAACSKAAGIGGLDAHGVPRPYDAMFRALRTHVLLDAYADLDGAADLSAGGGRAIDTPRRGPGGRRPMRPPMRPPTEKEVLDALASCRCYLAHDALHDATGFAFWAQETSPGGTGESAAPGAGAPDRAVHGSGARPMRTFLMGDRIPSVAEFLLCARSPRKAFLRLIGGGREIRSAYSDRLAVVAGERLAYRVEAYLPDRAGVGLVPWVFTNHIYAG